ncbi:MAG TPA: T9SS type A sorting domain-containing protein [Ignavibacteriaceae bacterium]|nr:T9SS type A sorting domain-containing protein [Ignavibacteriaceae bacterium]
MILKKTSILFILLTVSLFSQNVLPDLDSLFNAFLEMKSAGQYQVESPEDSLVENKKCGFGLASDIFFNLEKFDSPKKETLNALFQRPLTETSIVSESGFFRIHYDTTGIHKVQYDVIEFAKALDSSYNFEVNYLGYPPPVSDNGVGGDDRYDVYIQNAGGYYGYTQPENEITPGSQRYYSYIVVHNSFAGFYTQGIDAARVTAAHEFHHAIQMSNYILREINGETADVFFYEMTSTAMEEFVFNSVNDYYGYMKNYFDKPERSFGNNNGYNLAVWNIFLRDRFNFDVLKRQWEHFVNYRALLAIELSLNEVNSSFAEELSEFAVWTYFTNYRSITNKFFKEAEFYPVIRPMNNVLFTPPSIVISVNASPVANCFVRFYSSSNNLEDTLFAIVTNGDVQKGIQTPAAVIPFTYELFNYNASGSQSLDGYYYSKLDATDIVFFLNKEIINDVVVSGNGNYRKVADFVFPSPFNYKKHEFLYLPVTAGSSGIAEIYIYNINMELMCFVNETVINKFGNRVVKWNGKKDNGDNNGSGVYFYVVKSNTGTNTGKLVIINE